MNFFLIYPQAVIGSAYFQNGNETFMNSRSKDDLLKLHITTDYGDYTGLFMSIGMYILSNQLKSALEEAGFKGVYFKAFDEVIRDNNEDGSHIVSSQKEEYWLITANKSNFNVIDCSTIPLSDFNFCRGSLIVSEVALNFLYEQKAFVDEKIINRNDNSFLLTNRFLIEGDIENFILEKMPLIRKQISVLRRAEYRYQEGLPPLT